MTFTPRSGSAATSASGDCDLPASGAARPALRPRRPCPFCLIRSRRRRPWPRRS